MARQEAPTTKPRKWLMRQPAMRRMLFALAPVVASAVYFFGWRALAILAVCTAAGVAVEFVTSRKRGQPVSMACLVTCCLYAMSLPPTTPFWIAIVGVVVGVFFGKEVFGGFGRNFANPAIVGRAFVYVCFPLELTKQFVPVFKGFPAGLAHWSFKELSELPGYLAHTGQSVADAISQASPMWVSKAEGPEAAAEAVSWLDLAMGNIGGTFQGSEGVRILSAGSLGEGCAILIALTAAYLLATRTANWRLMLSCALGLAGATLLLRHLLGFGEWAPGSPAVPPLHFTLAAGTTMYALVYMVTEPVSAPNRKPAVWAYGFIIGFLVVFLRWRGVFVAAASFSILLGNLLAPLLDMGAAAWAHRRRAAKAAAKATIA